MSASPRQSRRGRREIRQAFHYISARVIQRRL